MLSIRLILLICFKIFGRKLISCLASIFITPERKSLVSLTLPQILSFFIPMAKTWNNFHKVEVTLSSLGNEVFNMPGVISAHPSKELTGSPTCELRPLPFTFPPRYPRFLLLPQPVSKTYFFKKKHLYKFSYFWAERTFCFGCEKSIAITSKRKRAHLRMGDRLLSLSV